jgi:hypothetical protein
MRQINGLLINRFAAISGIATMSLIALGGCALPAHNNTLIFSVKRDLGIGVSTPSAADQSVNITLGYKERQAAWVPLWANQVTGTTSTKSVHCSGPLLDAEKGSKTSKECKDGPKFVAGSESSKGNNDADDAYSTFASFGGDLTAAGDAGGKNANLNGKLASFFATGVAAQHLAKQTGVISDVFHPKQPTELSKKPNPETKQLETIKDFLDQTKDNSATDLKVRSICVTYLQELANITEKSSTDAIEKLPKTNAKTWVDALGESMELKPEIPYLARAAQRGINEIDKKLESKNDGKPAIQKEQCNSKVS